MSVELQIQAHDRVECLRFCSRPNCSLSEQSGKRILWAISLLLFVPVCGFALLGGWPLLPFAGLEVGVLVWVFDYMRRRRDDYELLEIEGEEIRLDCKQDGREEHKRLNRRWVQLVVENNNPADGHVRLAFRSHGHETEIGLFLNDEDRMTLAGSLGNWVGKPR